MKYLYIIRHAKAEASTNEINDHDRKLINKGIEGKHNFTRVVRADKKIKGLLYAGTETGFYLSKDDGENWNQLQLNLPVVPITDLYINDNDLIAATSGRSFWIFAFRNLFHKPAVQFHTKRISEFQNALKLGNSTTLCRQKNVCCSLTR